MKIIYAGSWGWMGYEVEGQDAGLPAAIEAANRAIDGARGGGEIRVVDALPEDDEDGSTTRTTAATLRAALEAHAAGDEESMILQG